MEKKKIYHIIAKELANECTHKEKEYLEQWLGKCNENEKTYQLLKKVHSHSTIEVQPNHAETTYQNMMAVARNGKRSHFKIHQNRTKKSRRSNIYEFLWVAAGITLLFLTGYFFRDSIMPNSPYTETKTIEKITRANPPGQKSTITLPDGSTVWLNAESSISFAKSFATDERLVELTGEAFFEVHKNKDRPFKVVSGDLVTTALGTSFNVTAYSEMDNIIVSLLSGKVNIISNDKDGKKRVDETIQAGFTLTYQKELKSTEIKKHDLNEILGWKNGIIVFNDASFEDIITKIRRWYGLEIVVRGHPSSDWKYTARFKDKNLWNILESIQFGRAFEFELTKNELIITFANYKT